LNKRGSSFIDATIDRSVNRIGSDSEEDIEINTKLRWLYVIQEKEREGKRGADIRMSKF
jgi:hypothetical protein